MDFNLQQRQLQKQIQTMSQKQIMSLKILSLSSSDMKKEIIKAVEENPVLSFKKNTYRTDYTRTASASASGEEAAENFQSALEAKADTRESLQDHLMQQINLMRLTDSEKSICEKLVFNLDKNGFHIQSPISLLDKKDKAQTPQVLEKCISLIQELEPEGVCVKNRDESLIVQARLLNAPLLVMYILHLGWEKILNPPVPEKILTKIENELKSLEKLFGLTDKEKKFSELDPTLDDVDEALLFFRKLNPNPAANYSTQETHFIEPDIEVEEVTNETIIDDDDSLVTHNGKTYVIKNLSPLPQIIINKKYLDLNQTKKELSKDEAAKIKENIRKAQDFIDSIEYRQNTINSACYEIIKKQIDFIEKGPGHLIPLKQQDIASIINVHETTISRMANSKFIKCRWGILPVKKFFSNAASVTDGSFSKDQVIFEIKKIIDANTEEKKLSDEKIKSLLENKGIKISRRTVAKYRSQMFISSSYNR
ncbi:MAG: RNA polymerase factor sigma-54 [Treponema sp.]|nr:RNA polymerase factor sigma-54 [Treponema sp.]